jgi:cbb3-type cytochrome c oxidase subunit III
MMARALICTLAALLLAAPTQADEAAVAAGKKLFSTHCSPCHGVGARGAAGPNLRDEATLHGNGYAEIFEVILNGVKDKPMRAWRDRLSLPEIEHICAYIKHLQANTEGAPAATNELGRYRM